MICGAGAVKSDHTQRVDSHCDAGKETAGTGGFVKQRESSDKGSDHSDKMCDRASGILDIKVFFIIYVIIIRSLIRKFCS